MSGKKASNGFYDAGFVDSAPKQNVRRNGVKQETAKRQPVAGKAKETAQKRTVNLRRPSDSQGQTIKQKESNPKKQPGTQKGTAPRRTVELRKPGQPKNVKNANNKKPEEAKGSATPKRTVKLRKPGEPKGKAPQKKTAVNNGAAKTKKKQNTGKKEIDESIRTQTRAQRTKKRAAKKVSGSAKKIEINRHDHNKKTTFRIKKKRSKLKYFFRMALVYTVLVLIVSSLITGFYVIKLNAGTNDDEKAVSVSIGDKNDERGYKYSSKVSYCNSGYFICIDDINELYSMTVTGDSEALKYITEDGEYSVSFVLGTRTAYINGTKLVMESDCYMLGGRLYVPSSFVKSYFLGISCNADDENGIVIERVSTEKDRDGNDVYLPLSFTVKPNKPISVIPEDSIE